MADRIVVMNRGRVEQVGSPMETYGRPASAFVADFIGAMNMFDAVVAGLDGFPRPLALISECRLEPAALCRACLTKILAVTLETADCRFQGIDVALRRHDPAFSQDAERIIHGAARLIRLEAAGDKSIEITHVALSQGYAEHQPSARRPCFDFDPGHCENGALRLPCQLSRRGPGWRLRSLA